MERTEKMLKGLIQCVLLFVFVVLIIIGQRSVGYPGLGMMMAGLAGILILLWQYNRSQR